MDAPTSTHIPAMLSVLSKKQNNGNKTHQIHKNWSGLGDMEKQKEREMNLKHIVCIFELIHKKRKHQRERNLTLSQKIASCMLYKSIIFKRKAVNS